MANVTLVFRDETAGVDLYTDSLPNPNDTADPGEKAARAQAIAARLQQFSLSGELFTRVELTGHNYSSERDGAVVATFAPFVPPNYAGTWTLYDVDLASTVVTWTGDGAMAVRSLSLQAELLRAGGTLHRFQVKQDGTVRATIG